MESSEDLALNQARATASVRLSGGVITRSKTYNQAFRSRQFGGVMSVEVDPFEDEAEEFGKVYAIMGDKGASVKIIRIHLSTYFSIPARNATQLAGRLGPTV